jgi:hypothetical protein
MASKSGGHSFSLNQKPSVFVGRKRDILYVRFLFLALSFLIFSFYPVAGQAASIPNTDRHGDWPIFSPPLYAPCNNCCSVPDDILEEIVSGDHHEFMTEDLGETIAGHLRQMANQISAGLSAQTSSLGTFLNAQNQQDALLSLQKKQFARHQDQRVGDGLCRFPSLSNGLLRSDKLSALHQIALSEYSLDRQFFSLDPAIQGQQRTQKQNLIRNSQNDRAERWRQYTQKFCDRADGDEALKSVCRSNNDTLQNADISFGRSFWAQPTLDVTLDETGANRTATPDQETLFALQKNLYANELLTTDLNQSLRTPENMAHLRGVLAKRSIAENSFHALASQRIQGSDKITASSLALLQELGVPTQEAQKLLTNRPSYNAQMEVLTRKLYQTPRFYENLLTTRADQTRQQTAMKSIELMQGRDVYRSLERSEMLLALLVEMKLSEDDITNVSKQGATSYEGRMRDIFLRTQGTN